MEILLASGNRHKLREIEQVLAPAHIVLPDDLGIEFSFEETGETFISNALGKALHLNRISGRPALADDSGLVVPALGGDPGVRSARYGDSKDGPPLTDRDRYELLLQNLAGIEDRRAMFVCCMVFVVSEQRFSVVQETFDGEIAQLPSGEGGFGYDPVFYVPNEGVTVAQLPADRKNDISHRGKALSRLKPIIAGY
jgi:XTP/dITP diphosphohydrolase